MISSSQLKNNLAKDGIQLTDEECSSVREFLIIMATIELDCFRDSQKSQHPEAGSVVRLQDISSENDLKAAA
jgi:hypothetical protein